MIADNRIMAVYNRFEKIKVTDDQIIPARKRSRRGIIAENPIIRDHGCV